MILLEKGDSFFGRKNNKKPLMRLNIDYKDPQSYIYLIDMDDSSYIQTQVSLPLVMHYTKIQNGQPRLIAYASKRIAEAVKNYSITKLEMCGLAMNIATFLHLKKLISTQ